MNIWDPSNLQQISMVSKHKKSVNCMQFNPHDKGNHSCLPCIRLIGNAASNLLATGASDSEVYIMDLNDPTKPSVYSPAGPDCQAKHAADVSCLGWNSQVMHILATAALNGTCTVWDLREKKPWCELRDSKGAGFTSLAWNPKQGLHLLTATDDDHRPVLRLWDLRSSTTNPLAEFSGHTSGVFSVSWCPTDNMLLLSCGKDNRTILWDLVSGDPIHEISDSADTTKPAAGLGNSFGGGHQGGGGANAGDIFGSNSARSLGGGKGRRYEVSWSPHLKGIVSTCSFDRKVQVFSMISAGGGQPNASGRPLRAPRWLSKRSGASLGFGGKLVQFGSNAQGTQTVKLSYVVDAPSFLDSVREFEGELNEALRKDEELFQMDLQASIQAQQQQPLKNYPHLIELCTGKADQAPSAFFAEVWRFMTVLFEPTGARDRISQQLGYDIGAIEQELEALVKPKEKPDSGNLAQPTPTPAPALGLDALNQSADANDVFGSSAADSFNDPPPSQDENPDQVPSPTATSRQAAEYGSGVTGEGGNGKGTEEKRERLPGETVNAEADDLIKKALLIGNFEAAVQCCLENNRLADALLLGTCGGEALWKSTLDTYLARQKGSKSYIGIVSAIIKRELSELVEAADLKGAKWKEVLAVISQYSESEEFAGLCELLGGRLEVAAKGEHDRIAATLCYMCAINVDKVVESWVRESLQYSTIDGLLLTIQLVSVYRHALPQEKGVMGFPAVMQQYIRFALFLAQQGQLDYAASYLTQVDTEMIDPNDPKWGGAAPAYWELHNSLGLQTLGLIDQIYGAHRAPEESLVNIVPQRWFPYEVKQINPAPEPEPMPAPTQQIPSSQSIGSHYGQTHQPQPTPQAPQAQSPAFQPTTYAQPSQYAQPQPFAQPLAPSASMPAPSYAAPQPSSFAAPRQPQPPPGPMAAPTPAYPAQPPNGQHSGYGAQPPAKAPGPARPIPVNDGFGSTAGNPAAGAMYGNGPPGSAPGALLPPGGATMQNSMQNTTQDRQPVTIMQPQQKAAAPMEPKQAPTPAPAPAPVKREMPAGMQVVVTSLEQLCAQLEGMQLSALEKKQLKEGQKSVHALNEKLVTGRIPESLQSTLLEFSKAVSAYELSTASQLRLSMTRTSWAEQKDWLKGITHLVNLSVKKFTAQ